MSVDFEAIKTAAKGRWSEILPALTPLSADVLTKGRDDHPCPLCNGKSVIWPAGDATQTGAIVCRKCTNSKSTGDGIATVAKWSGKSQREAAEAVANFLGVDGARPEQTRDIIAEVCRDKRMPLDAFMQFGPKVEKRGRDRSLVARVPVYNERGETHSYFDFAPKHKGWFARGTGMSGMFFPGRLPQPGETWLLVEGCKDAAALVGLGYNAAGLPTSCMADKYAKLFQGVDVIFVPDLDVTGQDGAQVSGGRLFGIAASVRVARLPGEVLEKSGADVRDVLAKTDGEQLVRQAIETANPWQPREGEHNPRDGRPEVLVTLAYGWVCDQVVRHLGRLGWESNWIPAAKRERLKVYHRGGVLVQVVIEENEQQFSGVTLPAGVARIRPLPSGQLPLRIADACQLLQEVERDGEVERVAVPPQRWLLDGVFTRGDYSGDVKRLESIITAPTIRPDGSILQTEGYDEKTGLLYMSDCKFPTVPESPTLEQAQKAADELLEVIRDFPFVDDVDRSAWVAMVLTMIGRQSIAGCTPLFANTATTRGSGKTLAVDAASTIAYGRTAPRKTFSGDDDEQRKAITATAIEALPSVLLDNVDCVLGGSSLDAALTATTWTDRILGSSRTTGELPLRTIWIATGNNLRFGSDLARRALPIRLAPLVENPEERNDFEHGNLLEWVRDNRPRLAVAGLTILRAYIVAGRPPQPGATWGSYESWTELIRNAIVWVGLADPLKTRETAKADDNSGAVVRGLISGLLEVDHDGGGLTAREIVDKLNEPNSQDLYPTMREIVAEVATSRGATDAKRLGYVFRKYRGRIVNNWQLAGDMGHGGVIRWSARPIRGWDGCDSGDATSAIVSETVCVADTHTHTHATHTFPLGEPPEQSHTSPPSPPSLLSATVLCECGREMVPSAVSVRGYRNWDCPQCGGVKPVQEREVDA